eukprot:1160277-Pelagomonas_calceolata.AAC.4
MKRAGQQGQSCQFDQSCLCGQRIIAMKRAGQQGQMRQAALCSQAPRQGGQDNTQEQTESQNASQKSGIKEFREH